MSGGRNVAVDEGFKVDRPSAPYIDLVAFLFLFDLCYPVINSREALPPECNFPLGLEIGEVSLRCSFGLQYQLVKPLLDSRCEALRHSLHCIGSSRAGGSLTCPKGDVK